ncbi:hypothetical protein SASPL_135436 [Salvia splendens]|uniref:CUE domain-containing protein n=1 Tax=Salvia splendens TaxID=180675 RepID=A0A8X8WYV3_SALSN|nr:hypothetical protein SASPL_135436 [Salvia splendens]
MEASFCKIKREQKADFDALKKAILDLSISSQGRSMETTDASSGNCKSQLELPKFVDDRDFHKSIDVDRAIADEDLMEQHSSESYEEMDIDLKIGVEDCIRVSTEIEDIEFLRSDTQHDEVIGGKMGKQFDIEVESAAMWQPRPIVHFELRFGVDARAVERLDHGTMNGIEYVQHIVAFSSIVCGKRSYFEDIDAGASSPAAASLPAYKKLRCSSSTSPVRFTYSPPVHTSSVDQLKDLFPELEIQLLEKALEESVNDLELAIKKLHEFCRGHVNEKIDTTEENATMEKVASQTSGDSVPLQEPQTQNNLPADGAEWVDLFVREMMSATSIDDARFRAASILESLEKSISPRACAEAAQNSYKENLMLKEHIEVLLRDNAILKRVIYQQDPFIYGCIDYNYTTDLGVEEKVNVDQQSAIARNTPEGRPKRRRSKPSKNKEELETQRMTHIVVERNRHRQMNDYLAGDQASIVGAAINFVKELEHQVQFMEAYKFRDGQQVRAVSTSSDIFSNFFTFPQYSRPSSIAMNVAVERHSSIADIEVTKVESHASIKIQAKRKPKQLLKMVAGFQSICLNITHLNITTVDQSVLYSFSVKVEDECQLSKVNEIATAVHEMIGRIHNESTSIA